MAKGKSVNVPNKVLHSRVSYLYQAASYLAAQPQRSGTEHDPSEKSANSVKPEVLEKSSEASCQSASRRLISDLRVVSLKVQIRMSPSIKHSVCKSCDTMLIDGSTCINEIENRSKGGKKPWADVLVRKCTTCGQEKRFPVTAERQKRRPHRPAPAKKETEITGAG